MTLVLFYFVRIHRWKKSTRSSKKAKAPTFVEMGGTTKKADDDSSDEEEPSDLSNLNRIKSSSDAVLGAAAVSGLSSIAMPSITASMSR